MITACGLAGDHARELVERSMTIAAIGPERDQFTNCWKPLDRASRR